MAYFYFPSAFKRVEKKIYRKFHSLTPFCSILCKTGLFPGNKNIRHLWVDGLNGRSSKVSFKFLQTFQVFRTCIYLLVYEIKIVTNNLMGFKIRCQVGGGVTSFSKLPYLLEFSNIWFQKLTDIRCKRSL